MVRYKNILITGSNGQLGNELKILSGKLENCNLLFTDIDELDITNAYDIDNFFSTNSIDLVINCAAYTAVDKAETEADIAKEININAIKNLIKCIKKYNSKLIHISTDYVFNGKTHTPYTETDTTNPNSVYGQTKSDGEKLILNSGIAHIIIRTSWLYSGFGNNFVKTIIKYAKEKNELNVVFDQIGTPTFAGDLAEAIIRIIIETNNNQSKFVSGIYHYSNEGVCSWYDFAYEIINITKLNCHINPIESKDYPTIAKRPPYSVLNKNKIKSIFNITIPHWRESLVKMLKD
ncbi:MAG: dTDP-4-dehydrorhamnose reductase [Bacteroidales bacterium]|nr:dTDP-4-dehydrorhamnose reductase [Bacteroidales bacterium]